MLPNLLTATDQLDLLHPVVADSYPEGSKDPFERVNHTIGYKWITSGCDYYDCPLCYSPIQMSDEPEFVVVGMPRYDPDVLALGQKIKEGRKKRVKHQKFLRASLKTLELMSEINEMIDSFDETRDEFLTNALDRITTDKVQSAALARPLLGLRPGDENEVGMTETIEHRIRLLDALQKKLEAENQMETERQQEQER